MLATFFYANEKITRDTLADLFLKVLVSTEVELEEAYDEDSDIEAALQGLATTVEALTPARNQKTKELTGTIKGEAVEKMYRDAWVIAYVRTLKARGFPVENPIEGATGEMNPRDEKQVHEYIEAGNSPSFNPVYEGKIEMPRWLVLKAAVTMGEIEGNRTASFYKYAREHMKDDAETRDPETKP